LQPADALREKISSRFMFPELFMRKFFPRTGTHRQKNFQIFQK